MTIERIPITSREQRKKKMTDAQYSEAKKKLRAAHWEARCKSHLSTGEIMDLNVKLRDELNKLAREFECDP